VLQQLGDIAEVQCTVNSCGSHVIEPRDVGLAKQAFGVSDTRYTAATSMQDVTYEIQLMKRDS